MSSRAAKKDDKKAGAKKDVKQQSQSRKGTNKPSDSRKGSKAADSRKNTKNTKNSATGASRKGNKDTNKAKQDGTVTTATNSKKETKISEVSSPKQEIMNDKETVFEKEESKEENIYINIEKDTILPKKEDFTTKIFELKKYDFTNKNDKIIEEIEDEFKEIEKALIECKKKFKENATTAATNMTKDKASGAKFMDVNALKKMIKNIGTDECQKEYNVYVQRTKCIDKAKELAAYDAKISSLTKILNIDNEKIIKNDILEIKNILTEAEPVLLAARNGLKELETNKKKKDQLNTIRTMNKAPALLQKTARACAIMIGNKEEKLKDWSNLKRLFDFSFIQKLIAFEARNITNDIRQNIEKNYFGIGNDSMPESEKLTFEAASRANEIAGDLVKWIEAQLKYNEFIKKVEPMQKKLENLEKELENVELNKSRYDKACIEAKQRASTLHGELEQEVKQLQTYY